AAGLAGGIVSCGEGEIPSRSTSNLLHDQEEGSGRNRSDASLDAEGNSPVGDRPASLSESEMYDQAAEELLEEVDRNDRERIRYISLANLARTGTGGSLLDIARHGV